MVNNDNFIIFACSILVIGFRIYFESTKMIDILSKKSNETNIKTYHNHNYNHNYDQNYYPNRYNYLSAYAKSNTRAYEKSNTHDIDLTPMNYFLYLERI